MEKMKYDMCGAATMIGAMRAIALLRPNLRVIAILCCTENMPDGKATKPGDVAFAMNGKSIEVINTDAEGRLVLADGLCYARQLGATHLIDAATLTGAVVVALGYHNVGIFSNNDEFAEDFLASTFRCGEKMWRMPVDPEYFEQIRSDIADIKNTGGRWGGAITAALFLKEFVADTLDSSGYRWHRLAGGEQGLDAQGAQRRRRPLPHRFRLPLSRHRLEIKFPEKQEVRYGSPAPLAFFTFHISLEHQAFKP